jgi:hypothetical protein
LAAIGFALNPVSDWFDAALERRLGLVAAVLAGVFLVVREGDGLPFDRLRLEVSVEAVIALIAVTLGCLVIWAVALVAAMPLLLLSIWLVGDGKWARDRSADP